MRGKKCISMVQLHLQQKRRNDQMNKKESRNLEIREIYIFLKQKHKVAFNFFNLPFMIINIQICIQNLNQKRGRERNRKPFLCLLLLLLHHRQQNKEQSGGRSQMGSEAS